MRILFIGTGDIGLPVLRWLLASGHELLGVISQPDKPAGRKQEMLAPPVKDLAKEHGLPGLAASDAHTVMEVGVAYTILDGPLSTAEEFRTAIASGPRLVTSHGSRLVRIGMPFAKVIQRVRGNGRVTVA